MMGIKVFCVFLLALAVASGEMRSVDTRMVGADNALPGEFPFMASLQWFLLGSTAHFCGGVIIGPVWILTVSFEIYFLPHHW